MVRAWEKVAKVAKEKVEAARYVGFLSSFLFSPAICSFSAYLIRICSYIHHINVSTFCLYFPTATQCGKGGKGDVASDILERFCEVCTAEYSPSEDEAEAKALSEAKKSMETEVNRASQVISALSEFSSVQSEHNEEILKAADVVEDECLIIKSQVICIHVESCRWRSNKNKCVGVCQGKQDEEQCLKHSKQCRWDANLKCIPVGK